MVTGIEAAGLALAVFPLLLEGLNVYMDGVQRVRDLRDWKRILHRLIRELKVECYCFEDICGKLLEGTGDAKELMKGNAWDDHQVQRKLRERMGPDVAKTFTELVKELLELLENLKEELGISDEPVNLNSQTWAKIKAVLQKENALKDISNTRRLLEILAQCRTTSLAKPPRQNAKIYSRFRKDAIDLYATLLETFGTQRNCRCSVPHNANLRLERIAKRKSNTSSPRFSVLLSFDISSDKQSEPLWTWREIEFQLLEDHNGPEIDTEMCASTPAIQVVIPTPVQALGEERRRDVVFRYVKKVFRPLFGSSAPAPSGQVKRKKAVPSIQATSAAPPQRASNPPTTKAHDGRAKKGVSFAIETSQEETTRLPPNANEIKNLCAVIASAKGKSSDLGVLASGKSWLIVTPTSWLCEDYKAELVSLDQLLQREDLDRGDRLRLGVDLASSLMHLHTTDWLGESWGKCDILFPQTAIRARTVSGETMILKADLKKPVVRRSFRPDSHSQQQVEMTAKVSLLPCDKNLFSLGIVLIELWFGKRLQDLSEPQDAVAADNTDINDWITARRLVPIIEEKAGEMYGGAVRRCIQGLDSAAKTLDNDEFKSKVITEVVSELERHWEAYTVSLDE